MAKNPKWWKDTDAAPEADEDVPPAQIPAAGEPVSEDLTHEQLDAVARDRQVEWDRGDMTKREKVAVLNGTDLV